MPFIVGDGPRRANLIKLADSLGLMPDTVRFCGETSDVASYYERADVFVLSSLHEGTPTLSWKLWQLDCPSLQHVSVTCPISLPRA